MKAFLIACAVAAVLWFFFLRPGQRKAGNQWLPPGGSKSGPVPDYERRPRGPLINFAGDGSYSFEVVGESNYQANLKLIAGAPRVKGRRHECSAVVTHEPHNKHDSNACAVRINGEMVGHLPREDAKKMVSLLKARGLPSGFSIECPAIIVGGEIFHDGRRGAYGVWLDIDEPSLGA